MEVIPVRALLRIGVLTANDVIASRASLRRGRETNVSGETAPSLGAAASRDVALNSVSEDEAASEEASPFGGGVAASEEVSPFGGGVAAPTEAALKSVSEDDDAPEETSPPGRCDAAFGDVAPSGICVAAFGDVAPSGRCVAASGDVAPSGRCVAASGDVALNSVTEKDVDVVPCDEGAGDARAAI